MSDSPLPWAWPAPELGEPAWPGPPPAYDPAAGAAYAPADADPDAANALPTPRRGSRRRAAPEPAEAPARPGPGTGRRGRPAPPDPGTGHWERYGSPDAGPEPLAGTGRRGRPAPADAGPEPGPGTGYRRRSAAPDAGPEPGPGTGRRGRPAPVEGGGGRRRSPGGGAPRTGRRRRAAAPVAPRDSWRRLVPQALVVAFLAGGTTAFVAADKSVRLTVDGVPRTVRTFAGDVDALLAAEGLGVGPHDLLAPAREASLDDGDEIVVRYGRPLRLTLDGSRRQVWTTARTIDGALRQLGVRAEGAYLSAPRTAPVPRDGLTLSVRTERSVTFMADGRERTIRTNAATVQEALDQAGVTLHDQDTTSVPPGSFPRDGQTVTVLRISGTREVREERIPYETQRIDDATLFAGTEVVEQAGRPGARRVTYSLRTVNGVHEKARRIAEETVREPVTQRVLVGTRTLPASVAGADGLDWAALAQCESGGRPDATDPSGTYGGLYQFDVRTWQALGGSGRPQDAPGQEQTYRAKKLYVQRGATPWPHCGRRLYR
ncbi:ubiquitin-like domain-containing protein [Streptomyces goshikiensis]|uniref:ubiquitin-like domain-containing protein n=1 Tax=Streptomyces goshikiensis TaxID=1942 RepID=UPI003659889C